MLNNIIWFAANGIDYSSNVMEVTFVGGTKPGDSQHIFIPLFSDDIIENSEIFEVYLSSVNPFSIIDSQRNMSTVEITDTSSECRNAASSVNVLLLFCFHSCIDWI